jgi:hypothetical protein
LLSLRCWADKWHASEIAKHAGYTDVYLNSTQSIPFEPKLKVMGIPCADSVAQKKQQMPHRKFF